jgi:hypothetical protein
MATPQQGPEDRPVLFNDPQNSQRSREPKPKEDDYEEDYEHDRGEHRDETPTYDQKPHAKTHPPAKHETADP